MNKTKLLFISSFAACLLLCSSGCSTWQKLDQKERGAVIGAGSGAVVGNAIGGGTGGTLLGGAAGALGGGLIGNEMDKTDRRNRRY